MRRVQTVVRRYAVRTERKDERRVHRADTTQAGGGRANHRANALVVSLCVVHCDGDTRKRAREESETRHASLGRGGGALE